ncbi:unnamed protein product [Triticum aestivum]|uniref:Uncharacterized protein n=4 Tax=Triticinae TaxID=1648030 RepID=A0A7H4LM09_WHEAT|nr:unnamed protein product [Triticum aestivum]
MEAPCDYQLAVADYWDGRPAMEPTAWVAGLPLQMTVAAPSNSDLVVSSSGRQQLKQVDEYDHYAVQVFEQAAESLKERVEEMETKMHLFPPSMGDLADEYAAPKVVSIGPYHHGRTPALQEMESVKHAAACHFVKATGRPIQEVYWAVCTVAEEARAHYDAGRLGALGDDDFKPMMFLDGCFLLQYMQFWCRESGGDEDPDMDPSLYNAFSSIDRPILSDVVLLENQLPWVVIDALLSFLPPPGLDMETLIGRVKQTLQTRQVRYFDAPKLDHTPPHLLGLLRHHIVGSNDTKKSEPELSERAKELSVSVSAMELAEIGIEITATKATREGAELRNMGVRRSAYLTGELFLAPLSLNDANATFLVNMAALEQCTTPDFFGEDEEKSAVCSYLCLLGMVTDSEEDVQQLRKKGILQGGAGLSNRDALDLLNKLENRLRPGTHYLSTMILIQNYKTDRWKRIQFHKFHYNHRKAIFLTFSGVAGFASFLGTLKSLKLEFLLLFQLLNR